MKSLLTVWLYLSLLAPAALGNRLAGPYQSVFLWYAYRMDIEAFGPGNNHIARDCVGTVPDKTCYFDEFLKYIEKGGRRAASRWSGHTTVGTDLHPNPFTAAEELANGGIDGTSSRYNNAVNVYKLLPDNFPRGAAEPNFEGLLKPVVDRIQECRQHVPNVKIERELAGVRLGMISVWDAREHDQSRLAIDGLNRELQAKNMPWSVETKPVYAPDGTEWRMIDTEATLNAHPEASTLLRDTILDYLVRFQQEERNPQHTVAIQAAQEAQGRLLQDDLC